MTRVAIPISDPFGLIEGTVWTKERRGCFTHGRVLGTYYGRALWRDKTIYGGAHHQPGSEN